LDVFRVVPCDDVRISVLPVALYGCETWSLTLREEHRRRVFKNRVLGRIFGPKRDKVTGEWRRLHNEELYDLYSSPYVIWMIRLRRMRSATYVACMGEKTRLYRVLVGKPEGKRPLGRYRHRREDNIKINLKGTRCKSMDWIYVIQDRDNWQTFANIVMDLWVPKNVKNFLTS
jgi:hypothetical protein